MRFRLDTIAALLVFLSRTDGLAVCQNAADLWHVAATSSSLSEEIRFTNGDATLRGTVYLPKTGNRLPAVVILHHAGLPTRQAKLYRHLCDGLPAMGIAVLAFDRRGSGESSGNLSRADYETLADDAIAGQHALNQVPPSERAEAKPIERVRNLSVNAWLRQPVSSVTNTKIGVVG